MMSIDLSGKRAFVAGIGDDKGYGWAIAKALHEAGASVCIGVWPQVLPIFMKLVERGTLDIRHSNGELKFEKVYPFDARYDSFGAVPNEVVENKRYKDIDPFTIEDVAIRVAQDNLKDGPTCLDIVVHSLANGPEVKRPLLLTSRVGYLGAISASAYSFVSMVQNFGPLMRPGGSFLTLSYMASERTIPGYGGGMDSAKAALECAVRTLGYEAGRKYGARVNCISAGPLASRAASIIGDIEKMIAYCRANSPLQGDLKATQVGEMAAFLCSPRAGATTGSIVYVDNGYHTMGMAVDQPDLSPTNS